MIEATHHRRKEELSQVLSPNRIQSLRKNLPLRSPRSSCSEQAPSRRKMRALSERHTFCAVLQQYVNKYRTFLYSGGCRFTHFQGIFRAFFVKRTHIRKCVRPWKKPWKCPTLEIGLFPGLFSGIFFDTVPGPLAGQGLFLDRIIYFADGDPLTIWISFKMTDLESSWAGLSSDMVISRIGHKLHMQWRDKDFDRQKF